MRILRVVLILLCILQPKSVDAISIIRDAEIEDVLTEMAQELFKIANLNPKLAKVYVVNSDEINAFTIGGGYIFITSGLLMKFTNPLKALAVMAHETGHIAAGHINKRIHILEEYSKFFSLAAVAGILGTVATGSPEAMALLLGCVMTGDRLLARYSREEELAADALSAIYMNKLGYSAKYMIDVLNDFKDIEIINGGSNIPQYIRSHPAPSFRISAIKSNKKLLFIADKNTIKFADNFTKRYKRAIAKLAEFLLKKQLSTEDSDDYIKAMHLIACGRHKEAIGILKKFIKEHFEDVYAKDMLAQAFFESGNAQESVKIYQQIYSKKAHTLIRLNYAKALIEADKDINLAIKILTKIRHDEIHGSEVFHWLAKAYAKQGREGPADLMLAYEQFTRQDFKTARQLSKRAEAKLDKIKDKSYIRQNKDLMSILERSR